MNIAEYSQSKKEGLITMKTKILISLCAAAVVLSALLGSTRLSFSGFSLTYSYYDAIFNSDSSWKDHFALYLRLLLFVMPLTVILIWVKQKFAVLAALALCAGTTIYYIITSGPDILKYGFSDYTVASYIIDFVPLIMAVLCFLSIRARKKEAPYAEMMAVTPVPQTNVCPKCGEQSGALFCPVCNTRIPQQKGGVE